MAQFRNDGLGHWLDNADADVLREMVRQLAEQEQRREPELTEQELRGLAAYVQRSRIIGPTNALSDEEWDGFHAAADKLLRLDSPTTKGRDG